MNNSWLSALVSYLLLIHPAWPLVNGALFVSKRRSPAPDGLLTFVSYLVHFVNKVDLIHLMSSFWNRMTTLTALLVA